MDKNKAKIILLNFIHQIDTQDNRGTAGPIQFLLQRKRTIWGSELNNPDVTKYAYSEYDYYDYDSPEEILKSMKENGHDDDAIKKAEKKIVAYQGEHHWETEQAFLTESALKRHREINGHNLKNTQDYVVHAYRDPELAELYEAIRAVLQPD